MALVSGYHHLTLCTDGVQEDYDFYTKVLGLHSVKRTVLFDGTMHLSQVHAICDELEQLIRKEFGTFDIMIHPEPAGYHDVETKVSLYEESQADGGPQKA